MTVKEYWKEIGRTSCTIRYVSDQGRCKTVWPKSGAVRISYGTLNPYLGYRTYSGEYMHRLVFQAFRGAIPKGMQIDHRNGIREDNRLANLRVCTRQQNNRTQTSRLLRSLHHTSRRHTGEMIEATRDSTTLHFRTGTEAARYFGVSHVAIYNAINKRLSARRVKGFDLRWVANV